ncbi:MAG: response regulator, partial [Rhodospirillaceae bacterium]|nr:response regulator [Rhodospirillaceae bacterium]
EYTRPGGSSLEIRRNPMPSGGFVTTYTDVTESRKAAEDLRESKVNLERRVTGRTAELMALNDQLRKEIDERTIVEEQLKLAKTEAEEANISKTKFLAAASHDLLQPLNAARLFTSALTDRKPSGKDGELAEGINGALRGVESMLNALLDISKLDAGAVPIETTDFPLSSLLSRIVSEHTPIAAEAGLTFRTVPCKAIVRTDRKLLGRIVRNLISNAIRYTPKGKILVGCRKRKDAIRLEVWDTGIGIPEDLREEIFEEFRQLGGETRDGDKGVGLGLAIVKRIAQIQNHLVGVQSIPGKGSVFYIDLPKGEMEANTTEASRSLGSVENKIPGTRVLVIDNEQTILDGMDSLLKGWECTVETGLSITDVDASMVSPDLIIIDYHLDDAQNGIDGIAALRKKLGSAILGIVITADRTEGIKAAVEKAGLYIMNKPVRPAKLRALIGHIRSE